MKVLLINGHPDRESFNYGIMEAYQRGVTRPGNEVKTIFIGDLNFNPNLQFGYRKRTELEPDLIDAQEKIKWADYLVWIYPLWWGMMPTVLKGFIDRAFLPRFAFEYKEDSVRLNKLLTSKSAHIINTMDYPVWYYKWFVHERGTRLMKDQVLHHVGIETLKTTYIGPIKDSKKDFREKWIQRIRKMAEKV